MRRRLSALITSPLYVIGRPSTLAGLGSYRLESDALAFLVLLKRLVQCCLFSFGHLFPYNLFYGLQSLSDESKLLLKNESGHGERKDSPEALNRYALGR
jgi:hypothetical protein